MSQFPEDIDRIATDIVRSVYEDDWAIYVAIASALLSERQRIDALCDEMAKEARRQALNEAEKAIGEHPGITYTNHRGNTDWRLASRQDFIDAIRALSESSPNPLPEQIANIGKEGE